MMLLQPLLFYMLNVFQQHAIFCNKSIFITINNGEDVCLFICACNNSASCCGIWIKFSGWTDFGSILKAINFENLHHSGKGPLGVKNFGPLPMPMPSWTNIGMVIQLGKVQFTRDRTNILPKGRASWGQISHSPLLYSHSLKLSMVNYLKILQPGAQKAPGCRSPHKARRGRSTTPQTKWQNHRGHKTIGFFQHMFILFNAEPPIWHSN